MRNFTGGSDGKNSACKTGDLGLMLGSGIYLEKGMTTHSSILAWRIPWTEEPGGLQSMGSQRARQDLTSKQQQILFQGALGCIS